MNFKIIGSISFVIIIIVIIVIFIMKKNLKIIGSISLVIIIIVIIVIFIMKKNGSDQTKQIKENARQEDIVVLTYADDRFGRKDGGYKSTQSFIKQALADHPDVRDVITLDEKDLFSSTLYKKFKDWYDLPLHSGGAGNGFKPFFMLKILDRMSDGDYLLWHDSSPEIWDRDKDYTKIRLRKFMRMCTLNRGILVPAFPSILGDKHTHEMMTTPQCMDIMGTSRYKENPQWCTSWVLVQKSKYVTQLLEEWMYFMTKTECASMSYLKEENKSANPKFVEHRYDQSVLTLLMLRDGLGYVKTKGKCIFENTGELPNCFATLHKELGEREVADQFTRPDACVLEFGGGAGNVSTIIQSHLNNKQDHVVIQPNDYTAMFDGVLNLEKNKKACESQFQIIDHILKHGEGKELMKMVSKPFDTLVVDCEDCLVIQTKNVPMMICSKN
jgi:Ca2+/Na+ antiporter